MGWKELEYKDRWSLVTGGVQALATLGTFIVALVGIWKVAPIIAYQIQQQEPRIVEAQPKLTLNPVADRFVLDALVWWGDQVKSYRRIIELTSASGRAAKKVSFKIIAGGGVAIAPGVKPDLLEVTAVSSSGKKEVVTIPVNKDAMSPSQYLRFKLNQNAFATLPKQERRQVETAVERYINHDMVPKVPPIYVRSNMTIEQLHTGIAMNQHHREEALRHVEGLDEVLASAMQPR